MKNALNQPIEIGKKYGYSKSDNGFTAIVIGICTKITEKRATLKVTESRRYLYDDFEIECGGAPEIDRSVSIKPVSIFPVNQ